MIFFGPLAPKFMVDTFVASEKVGEGGLGTAVREIEPNESALKDRGPPCTMVC